MGTNNVNITSKEKLLQNKIDFLDILTRCTPEIDPDGKFYHFLELSDFFTAPASTRYHESYDGGLVEHSLNVYKHLTHLNYQQLLGYSDSSIAKTALLHDICKANFYRRAYKNKKLEDGQWIRTLSWEVNDQLPLGHGEKSVTILLVHGVPLTDEEMLAIRWHMGGFDASARDYAGGQALSGAMSQSKLVTALHIADMMSVWL